MAKKKEGAGSKGIGRWVPIGMTPATAAWKNVNRTDEHLIFLLDSASGEITVCGDTSGVRTGLGMASGKTAPIVTPPRRKRSKPSTKAA
ncbi:MAG: hypothetical protein JWO70_4665 [Betaproteobacteria bacterium]|nr:hypothetical protein [Betaproteobacteria bacterium]